MKTNRPAFRIGCLIFAAAALTVSPSFAQTQEPGGATATASVISSVAVTQASLRESVRVEGEGPLEVRASRMQNPERLVLDFTSARLATQKATMPGVSAPVRGVRLGQYRPDVARIVVDLTAAAPYQILREGPAVVVAFDVQPEAPVDSSVTTTMVSAKPRPSFQYNASTPHVVAARAVKQVSYRAPRFALPSELTQPSVVLASYSGKDQPVRPIAAQEAAAQATAQAGNAAATVGGAQQSAAVATSSRYSGEPISVNLKDVDLRDFFRLIHEISGLNVVLDPNVKGNLTIVLDEVPWDQALDIVLQNNGLDKQLHGNVLRIATLDTIKKEAETARDVRKAENDAQEMITVTRVLNYAKAETMAPTLKKFLTGRGDILFDARSNQLIIRDIPAVIPNIDNLLRQLDRKSQQVEIEARVVAATRAFAQDIGTELGFAGSTTGGRSLYSGSPAVGGSGVTTSPGIPASPVTIGSGSATGNGISTGIPLSINLGASAPTSGFGFTHRSPNFAVDFFITAAESKGVGKLLSKPRIVTQNNEKATVKQGVKIPIQTTINNTISVQYIDAVLKLEVTPQITADGTVFMDVLVENTQIDQGIPRIQGVPALDTESAESKITVADGATIVVGGVIVTSSQVNITQVPVLGSLPLIGNLFRRNSTSVNSSELLFFLTPRIIPSA
jgi:type IV pilus assembly protein PilQ